MSAPAKNRHSAKWKDKKRLDRMVEALEAGNSRTTAFRLGGCNADTVFMWLKNARDHPEEYPELVEFLHRVEDAEAKFQEKMVEKVVDAAQSGQPNTWQAAMTMLERRDPENWGKRERTTVEIEGPLVQLNQVVLVDSEAREHARSLLQRIGSGSTRESLGVGMGSELEEDTTEGGRESIEVAAR